MNSTTPPKSCFSLPTGELLHEYWHSGHLNHLQAADLDGNGRTEFVLAGINNARHAATLVVLDEDHFAGASQEPETPDHQLLGSRQATNAIGSSSPVRA